jgi:hypothetical protein
MYLQKKPLLPIHGRGTPPPRMKTRVPASIIRFLVPAVRSTGLRARDILVRLHRQTRCRTEPHFALLVGSRPYIFPLLACSG